MCFNAAIYREKKNIEKRFQAFFKHPELFNEYYHVNAFSKPFFPVIASNDVASIQFFRWGLVPFWVKDVNKAEQICKATFNARSETIFEKPSFRQVVLNQRCLVLVNGFYEWHEENGKKYPFYIHSQEDDLFALAGIWDHWQNPQTSEMLFTFSIVTTTANTLLGKIHNVKKRMPVILKKKDEKSWLDINLTQQQISALLWCDDSLLLEAYPVSRKIAAHSAAANHPDVIKPFIYQELSPIL